MNRAMPFDVACRVAAFGVQRDAPPILDAPLDSTTWHRFTHEVQRHRLQGLVAAAISQEQLAVTDEQATQALTNHRRAMSMALVLERDLGRLSTTLESCGFPWRVLKGPAAAHLDYRDPATRPFRDVDVLIHADGIEEVRDLLMAGGCSRRFPEPRPGYDRRFGKGICLVSSTGREIDLHRTLSPGPFGLSIVLDDLFAGASSFIIAGRKLPALDRPRRFVHACYHALLGSASPSLMTLRDIVQTAPLDAEEMCVVAKLCRRWGGEAVVAGAVASARASLSWTPPSTLATHVADHHTRRWDAFVLGAYHARGRSSALQAITGLGAVGGVRPRLAYAAAVFAPRAHRHPTSRRLRRGFDAAKSIMRR